MAESRPKKLFKVASEFNVATQSIVDTLSDNDFDIPNRPNSKITPEMYEVLSGVYGDDKEKSREHERAKEEYESRRNQIMSKRNESVTIDNFLEPIDEKEEAKTKEEPKQKAAPEPSLEPQEEPVQEEKKEEPVEAKEKKKEKPAEKEKKEEPKEVEAKEEKVEEKPEPKEEEKPVETKSEEKEKTEEVKTEEVKTEEKEVEKPTEEEPAKAEKPKETKEEEPVAEEDSDSEDEKEEDPEKIIRGSAGKLTGTKVVGKVSFTKDKSKSVKKRKRRKDRADDAPIEKKAKKSKSKEDSKAASKKSKPKAKKTRGGGKKVDEEDVEKKMRETMQRMQQSGTVGSKRQKRRRQRKEEREEEQQLNEEMQELENEVLDVTEFITVSDLADLLEVKPNDVITTCMSIGMMVSINQRLDASTIELVASEFDYDVNFVDADEVIEEVIIEEEDDPADLEPRSPIITVMGHVDHGKTSLLDYIRKEKVAAGEAGGITQHVGAYEVVNNGKKITFLDTPGHEAFTAMRSRGAQATDIVILVIAADDAVMPQTIEAINHAKAAGVSIVVAINKMDKEGANPDKIKQQLSEHGVIVEEYGGTNQVAEVSAETGSGIEELLEKVLIEAELMELKANPNRLAQGIVLESRVDKGKGTVANILVQNGTLKVGDPFVAGPCFGRVRAMENEKGERLKVAGPSTPVQLTGFDETPQAGDRLVVPKDEKTAKEIANQRHQIRREQSLRRVKHLTLDDLSRRMALGEVSELNIIIKADVDGSIEALSGALQKLSTEEVSVNIIHTGSGAITESDVLLASASDAIIIGFQVRPSASARKLAEAESIDVRLFSVIYDAVDEVHDALEGLLSPEISEEIKGMVTVREVFKVSKVGTIAGCYVTEGKVSRNNPIRIIRDGVVIWDGEIDSLKRFKDDVKEVQSGYECGISIVNFNDIKVGDEFESYAVVEAKRKLEDAR
ncbi:MAG: translation initiation factor IF-2 [Balneolaceae bacterium]